MVDSLLLVDDEPDVSRSLSRLLKRDSYLVYTACNAKEALSILNNHPIKVVISDQRMPHMTGSQLLTRIKELFPDTVRIILSGHSDFQAISDAVNKGEVYKFVSKPWDGDKLRSDVRKAFQMQNRRWHSKQLSRLFDSTVEAIVLTDTKGVIENINQAFIQFTQFTRADVIGKPIDYFFLHCGKELFKGFVTNDKVNTNWQGELVCRCKNGQLKTVRSNFVSVESPDDTLNLNALFIETNRKSISKRGNSVLPRLLSVENSLKQSIEQQDFVVFYQPQSHATNGDICGCEALVRWQHPKKGIVAPSEFIGIAENSGLILPIGKNVMQQGCEQLAIWRYHDNLQCNLSFNLSSRQFNDPELVSTVCELIARYRLEPQWLELEVTESTLLGDIDQAVDTLTQLRDVGVRIALDDFGTGYSSLSYLKKLPVDTLKIDRSFVKELPDDNTSMVITLFLLAMAKSLGLNIVAEGVETEQQYEFLRNEGCDLLQGYFISPPLRKEQFIEVVSRYDKEKHKSPENIGYQD